MKESVVIETPSQLHYAWIVAGVGALATFCGLGLARFAFGMMLPSISASLSLDYGRSGLLGFANLIGYFAGVAILPFLTPRLGGRTIISGGLLLVGFSMLWIAWTNDFNMLCVLYFLTSIGSGATVVPAMSLVAHWFYPSHRGLASGLVMLALYARSQLQSAHRTFPRPTRRPARSGRLIDDVNRSIHHFRNFFVDPAQSGDVL